MKKMQKGFTLIELMIVVAIIGVLSAIAVPAYKSYVKKSEAAAGVSTVRSLLTNIDMFEQEKGAFPSDTEIGDIGGAKDMSALGTITLTPKGTAQAPAPGGTAVFKFSADATLKNTLVTFTKTAAGWKCTHTTGETLKSCAAPKA
ncbi:pilin [Photobacterium kagoshimensis]|uniref:pilin n=1 Tax=Photobacterium kagoshimensis TaxID=2910242 RepID=UPI003D0E0506